MKGSLYRSPISLSHCRPRGQAFSSACQASTSVAPQFRCDCALDRRGVLAASLALLSQTVISATAKAETKAPPVGACVECIGEINGGLNACTLASPSCVSTQNDDEAHFIPPWQYNERMEGAVQQLADIATGNLTPQKASNRASARKVCFNGQLQSRHKTPDGSEYLHIVFGGEDAAKMECRKLGVIDAEFIFLAGDNVVDIRAASRDEPGVRGGNVSLSLAYGVQYDTNVAKREMEELRTALRWEQVPVVTDFDPRFNQRRPLFFERLYQPFLRDKQNFEDIHDK